MVRERTWENLVYTKDEVGVLEIYQIHGDKRFVHYFDASYFDYIASRHWSIYGNGNGTYGHYARTAGGARGKRILLHHVPFILQGICISNYVDHISRNTYDSREQNLRLVTNRENHLNSRNSTAAPNLSYDIKFKQWRPRVRINRKQMYSPVITDYELAKKIAETYGKIGVLFDGSVIVEPTRDQMIQVVECIKDQVGDPIGKVFGYVEV